MGGNLSIVEDMESVDLSLSCHMRKSWEDKIWMVNLAARNCWAFDFLFWKFLGGKFFGVNEEGDHRPRIELLTEQEVDVMQCLVGMKVEESQEAFLVEWDDDGARQHFAKFMV